MSGRMIWFEVEFKNRNFCPRAHLPQYMGVGVGTLAGCANPIILPDLCFTLEMATFELVTQHIAWIFNFNIPLLLCTISPIHYAKFKKNSYSQSRAIRMGHFWVQNGRFALNKHFLGKIINIILIFLLTHFTVPILKKNLQ